MLPISVSTPPSVTRDSIRGDKQVCLPRVRHPNQYVISSGIALVLLLATVACNPVGRQQDSATPGKNDAASQSGSGEKDLKPVPFAAFTVKFEVEDPKFQVDGDFTLGPGNNGINLMNDNVNLKIGRSSMVIPAGSFKQDEKGKIRYEAVIDGLAWTVVIRDLGEGNFRLKAKGEGAKQFGQLKPEDVILTIGDDSGTARALSK
jgi:hypothetical protein